MRRRDCLGIRDVLAGNGTLGRVADGIAEIAGGAVASSRSNSGHKAEGFLVLAALAAGLGASMSTFALERAVEKATPSRDGEARTMCFALSLAAHNACAVARTGAQADSPYAWLSQAMFRLALVRAAANSLEPKPEPESPPPVWH